MSNPSLTAREYNPTNGAFVGNLTSLSFSNTPVGTHSAVKVIDLAFTSVASVSNLRLAVVSAGDLSVTDSPSNTINVDGTTANGYFGIQHTSNFDPTISLNGCLTHFRGVYTPSASPSNDVSISLRNETAMISQYIYLDIQLGNNDLGANGGNYRVLFDYV